MKINLLLFLILISLSAFGQNGETILRKSIDAVTFDAFEMRSVLKIYDGRGNLRERELGSSSLKTGVTTMMMIRFLSPPDIRGTSFLVHDHDDRNADMWIYLPATRRTRRLSGRDLSSSFMGSEFSNANMSTPNLSDFEHSIGGFATVNGRECWKVESKARTAAIARDIGYHRQVSFIDKENFLSYKVEYYNTAGNHLKTQTLGKYRQQKNGKYFYFHMEMKNESNGRSSVIETSEFSPGSSLTEKDFTVMALER